jgi:DNA-binding winged helix-turn-helix (wHTH) protein/tetratricopeptide (TPR) repeat protein
MATQGGPRPDLAFLDFELSPSKQELRRAGVVRPIEPQVYRFLEYLSAHPERVVTKNEIFRELWRGEAISAGVLSQCVWAARQAVDDDGDKQQIIKTVRGSGYRFIAPLRTVREVGAPAQSSAPPADRAMTLIGREPELRALTDAFELACASRGHLQVLLGEAGIGKTHLAEQLGVLSRASGATVLSARCLEADSTSPYGPWVQLVQRFCESAPASVLRELMGPGTADLAEVVPQLRIAFPELPSVPPLSPAQARLRLFGSFAAFIKDAATLAPLLIVIEDIQDADEPSINLLELVASSIATARVLFLVTHRTEANESAGVPGSVARLLRCPGAKALTLAGLSLETTGALVRERHGSTVDARLVAAIHKATQGNPLFVIEVVRLVALQHGSLDRVDPASPVPLPERIQHITAARLRHLSPSCIDTLELASAFGREIDAPLLAAVGEREYPAVLAELDDAVAASMLEEHRDRPGSFRFCHDLIRLAVYRSMPAAARARRHALIGLGLERLVGGRNERLDELAHHFSHADPLAYAERALLYRLSAAEHCSMLTAYEDAILHYERALILCRSCTVSPRRVAEIRLALGVAQIRAKRADRGKATLEAALDDAVKSGAELAIARAAIDITPGFLELPTGTTDWFNIRILETALRVVPEAHEALRARLLASVAIARGWADGDETRERIAHEAVALAERSGDKATFIIARSARHTSLLGPSDLEGRLAEAQEIIRDAESIDDRETSLVHRYLRISALVDAGHPETADHEMEAFVRLATTLRQPQGLWYAQRYTAMRALMAGRFQEAERLGREFLEVGSKLEPENALQSFGAQLAGLYWQTGRTRELLPLIEPHALAVDALPSWQATLAFVAAYCGELELAREVLDRIAGPGLRSIRYNGHYLITMNLLADACAILGDVPRAAVLYDCLAPYERQHVGIYAVFYRGTVRRSLASLSAVLGQHDRARALFERAIADERRVGSKPFEAISSYELACVLRSERSAKTRARADALLEHALALSRELGMPELEQRVLLTQS